MPCHAPRQWQLSLPIRAACEHALLAPLQDWWWKARLGQCYLRLGLLRDAEKQLSSALRCGGSVACALQLAHCHLRMDQPTAALALYQVSGEGSSTLEPLWECAGVSLEGRVGRAQAHVQLRRAVAPCSKQSAVLSTAQAALLSPVIPTHAII